MSRHATAIRNLIVVAAGVALLTDVAVAADLTCAGVPAAQGSRDRRTDPMRFQPYVIERSLRELAEDIRSGRVSSEQVVRAYLARIDAFDRRGPCLQSVISVNPRAVAEARVLDAERRSGQVRGPLHGVPLLIKDNIETRELPTTAGSMALRDNRTGRDAPVVARLRAAGAIVLGKTNLSEWAQFRDRRSLIGWSAMGGLTRNPYALDRSACGSSSGSASSVAASMAAASVGTETNSSILCPAAVTGLVGLKPTVGLVSRTHVVPLSHTQDTVGPLGRSVADVAALLTVMAGSDAADPATAEADARRADYSAALAPDALAGVRLGVLRPRTTGLPAPGRDAAYRAALETLQAAGATLVEVPDFDETAAQVRQSDILATEFKDGLNVYLQSAAAAVKVRSLQELIAFNRSEPREMALFGQDMLEVSQSSSGLNDAAYRQALDAARRAAGPDGIDRLLRAHNVAALVGVTTQPAAVIDLVNRGGPAGSITTMTAIAGYPHLTVPMGLVMGLPVGLSFIGPAWSESRLLGYGYAFEQRKRARRAPTYASSVNALPDLALVVRPLD